MRSLVAMALVLLASSAIASPLEVSYRVTIQPEADPPRFAVEMEFPAGQEVTSPLKLPTEFGAGRHFHRAIRNLRVLSPGAILRPGFDEMQRVLSHPPGGRLRIAYEVVPPQHPKLEHATFYDVRLRADHFHAFGHALFVVPVDLDHRPATVHLEFHGFPSGWSFASSYGLPLPGAAYPKYRLEGVALSDVKHALYVGGDFRIHTVAIRGRPLHFAIRGHWPFTDAQFTGAAARVVEAHRSFWDDHDFPAFLISLVPNDVKEGSSHGGTAVRNAFAMHVSRDFTVPGDGFDFLVGHEHLHTWVPGRFGSLGDEREEALHYWFSEGFTNYLTHRLLVRSGLWSLERYAEAVNAVIAGSLASKAAGLSNADVARAFWTNDDAQKMPYQRGELLALHWNEKLLARRDAPSLDRVLQSLQTRRSTGRQMATDRLTTAVASHVPDWKQDYERVIARGLPPAFTPGLLGPCYQVREVGLPEFDAGFDVERSWAAKQVLGVREGSAAHAAGLRDGEPLLGYSITRSGKRRSAEISVRRGRETEKVAYRPERAGEKPVPQYFVKAGAAENAACKAWF